MDKTNKIIVSMLFIFVLLFTIVMALLSSQKNKRDVEEVLKTKVGEEIFDECTDEYEEMAEEVITTNSKEIKISPQCKIILSKYYKGCKDTINDYLSVPKEYVNLNKEEFQSKYKDWEIKEFSSEQVRLYKEFEGKCGEHYILKDKDGKISIYKINEYGKEEEYEKTDIATDYLPDEDRKSIINGVQVNGKEQLNKLIESFL